MRVCVQHLTAMVASVDHKLLVEVMRYCAFVTARFTFGALIKVNHKQINEKKNTANRESMNEERTTRKKHYHPINQND